MSGFDLAEFIKRIVKYLVLGLIVAVISYIIPKKSLNIEEIAVVALSSASTFAILDTFLPSVSASAKQGLGFVVGANLGPGLKIMGA
jgi:threonine/homoserine efflux transporter RhtA